MKLKNDEMHENLDEIFQLLPSERRELFEKDSKIITELLQHLSYKYKGYLVGVSISKSPQTYDWTIVLNMDAKLMTDKKPRYHGEKFVEETFTEKTKEE